MRLVSSTEGLVALASSVVRNASTLLLEVSTGDIPVMLNLGDLERHVLLQLAVAEEWKLAQAGKQAASTGGGMWWSCRAMR